MNIWQPNTMHFGGTAQQSVYDTPKVAFNYHGTSFSSTVTDRLSKFKLGHISVGPNQTFTPYPGYVNDIRAKAALIGNDILIGNYVNIGEAFHSSAFYGSYGGGWDKPTQKLIDEGWWLFKAPATVTFDAGTDVMTFGGGASASTGERVKITTTGTLPGGLTLGTDVYYRSANGKLYTSYANAVADTAAINITSAGTGTHTAYVYKQDYETGSTVYDVNLTDYPAADSGGKRWTEWYADFIEYMGTQSGIRFDYWFLDNHKYYGLTANWLLDGVNRANTDATVKVAIREGHREFIDQCRANDPTRLIIGNGEQGSVSLASQFHESTELDGQADGILLESAMGQDGWNQLQNAGWQRVRDVLAPMRRSAPTHTRVQGRTSSATDYQRVRFTLATAMLDDVWAIINNGSSTILSEWYDEYDAQIGTPLGVATQISGDKWIRTYTNGLILVNGTGVLSGSDYVPASSPANDFVYTPSAGFYKRIDGSQVPAINSGATVSGSVTVPPWDGLLLLCVTPGIHP